MLRLIAVFLTFGYLSMPFGGKFFYRICVSYYIALSPCTRMTSASLPTTSPANNQFVAVNSLENVTYNCSVPAGSTVVWEVEGSQIRSQEQFEDIVNEGYFIEPMDTESTFSTISVSAEARQGSDSDISVQCVSSEGINSVKGNIYFVITFGASYHLSC